MKPLITFVFILLGVASLAQPRKDSFIRVNTSIDSTDEYRIRTQLLGIETSKYFLPSTFAAYHCDLVIEEYFEGQVVKTKSFRDSMGVNFHSVIRVQNYLEKKGFPLIFDSQYLDSTLRLYIAVGGLGIKERLRLRAGMKYSWKEVYNLEKNRHPLRPGENFPLLVFSSAVSREKSISKLENASEFCLVSGEKIPVKNWYPELGIRHFFLFSLRLEK